MAPSNSPCAASPKARGAPTYPHGQARELLSPASHRRGHCEAHETPPNWYTRYTCLQALEWLNSDEATMDCDGGHTEWEQSCCSDTCELCPRGGFTPDAIAGNHGSDDEYT